MADQLVQLKLSSIFRDFGQRVERLRDSILRGAQPIVRRNWALSVRGSLGSTYKFYRSGAMLRSAKDEFFEQGAVKGYRLFPTAFYAVFGEYGTGRLGAATGRPAPAGWRYGQQPGMRARRFARHALAQARPQIELSALRKVRQFAQNATVR